MSPKEQFMAVLASQASAPADAIILLAGDGMHRIPHTARLYRDGFAPLIAVLSGDTRKEYGSATSGELAVALRAQGVPDGALYTEETAQNTREEAMRALALARERGWKSLILVSSPHHQYRAFLTTLAAMREQGTPVRIAVSSAPLPWFAKNPWGRRIDLLKGEMERIEKYRAAGHVATFEEGLAYLESSEK